MYAGSILEVVRHERLMHALNIFRAKSAVQYRQSQLEYIIVVQWIKVVWFSPDQPDKFQRPWYGIHMYYATEENPVSVVWKC